MKPMTNWPQEELAAYARELAKEYEEFQKQGLKLNMSRGVPGTEQLDMCEGMLTVLQTNEDCLCDGVDTRNYGGLDGLPGAKKLFADILGLKPENIIVGGNSSLNLMYDAVARAMTHGVVGSVKPWCECPGRKFLCPVPGYDRHFAVTEHFGFEMINIPMDENGPDMDMVERLVAADADIKGIWGVPKYSNPTGIVYSDETIRRLASLKPAAPDFRIFYDNAYVVHHLTDERIEIANIFDYAKEAGNENIVFEFASTSKFCFPGAGISCIAASMENIGLIKAQMFYQTIGPDKINQLRHIRFFDGLDAVHSHMRKQAAILKPKFDAVLSALQNELSGLGIGSWTEPKGGYFVSFNTLPGCAKRTVQLMKEAGVIMTSAGATYPYQNDPEDRNIRIAPSFPPVSELETAMRLFCLCVKRAAIEKLLKD